MSAIISMFLGMDDLYQITYDREAVIELFKNSDDELHS